MNKLGTIAIAAIVGGATSMLTLAFQNDTQVATITDQIEPAQQMPQAVNTLTKSYAAPEARVDFTTAASKSIDAVVHVKTMVTRQQDPRQQFFYRGYGRKQPQQGMATGSGVVISKDGFIVTNNHVIKDANDIKITLNNRKTYQAELIGTDPNTDLALLKIDADNLPFVPYGNSDDVKVGEWVLAVGNPFNLTSTVTAGIVSAKGRDINILEGDRKNGLSAVESFIQTDAAVNPGNSGGALVSSQGELVGINTAIKSNTGSYTGYSFAIPVNIVRKVVDDLLNYGTVQRGFIGVSIRNIDQEIADEMHMDSFDGVFVAGVVDRGAAKDAGIEKGDVITHVGDVEVSNVPELQEQISNYRPGDNVDVTVLRDHNIISKSITLKNKFGNTKIMKKEAPNALAHLGADFNEIDADAADQLQIDGGVQVSALKNGKLLKAGIKNGFIITRIDKKPILSTDDLDTCLKNKKGGVLLEGIYPNGMNAYYGFGL